MKKFTIYLKEAEQPKLNSALANDIKEMITKSSDGRNDFISDYKQDPDSNQIEGLINNSDIYDFYLKYMDEIDEILAKNDYYKKSPEELNVYSIYEYVIIATKEAVNYVINGLGNVDNRTDF